MAEKSKNQRNDFHSKQLRRNQIIFGVFTVLIILSMVLSALSLVKF